jgi:hypothetical protein
MIIARTLIENLDALFAGIDSDSGIRDPLLLESCIQELKLWAEQLNKIDHHRISFLDIVWDIAVELYGDNPYTAEDRLEFIDWLTEEAGVR